MKIKYIDDYILGLNSRTCGENLEYSAEFIELERLVSGGGDVEYGEYVYASDDVDWVAAEQLCRTLCEITLDLRLMVILARCLLERYGFDGFIAGLRVISLLLRQHWNNFHPNLVAEDRFDPLIRINNLAELAVPGIMVALKRQTLASTEDGQALCLADLDIISNGEGVTQNLLYKLLGKLISPNCSVELVRSLGQINTICSELNEITRCLEEKTAVHGISPLQNISSMLRKWALVVEEHFRIVSPQLPASTPKEWSVAAQPKAGNSECSGDSCNSPEDVVRALDTICAYYQQQEPSSPVPFLLARVRRLINMSFINIIAELAPDAISDLRRLGDTSID